MARRRKRTLVGTWFALYVAFSLLTPFHDSFSTAHMVWAWSWSISLTILEGFALSYNARVRLRAESIPDPRFAEIRGAVEVMAQAAQAPAKRATANKVEAPTPTNAAAGASAPI